ncbi:MAG: hypothetical protein ACTSRK_20985 [Promethearchaeota archaeon]
MKAQDLSNLPSDKNGISQIPLSIEQASKIAVDWIDERYKGIILLNEEDGINPMYWFFQFGYLNSEEVRAEMLIAKKFMHRLSTIIPKSWFTKICGECHREGNEESWLKS